MIVLTRVPALPGISRPHEKLALCVTCAAEVLLQAAPWLAEVRPRHPVLRSLLPWEGVVGGQSLNRLRSCLYGCGSFPLASGIPGTTRLELLAAAAGRCDVGVPLMRLCACSARPAYSLCHHKVLLC